MENSQFKTLRAVGTAYISEGHLGEKEKQWLYRFVQWAPDKLFNSIQPVEIENYANSLPSNSGEIDSQLRTLRQFLSYAKNAGYTTIALGQYLKIKRVSSKKAVAMRKEVEKQVLTSSKKEQMECELNELKEKRVKIIDDIRRAAADKDLKENAPYHAAREEKAKLDGKILELETILKHAVVCDVETRQDYQVSMGSRFTLIHEPSGKEICYTLVMPREVNALEKRISPNSPVGQAVMGHKPGDVIEVRAPAGRTHYRIKSIG